MIKRLVIALLILLVAAFIGLQLFLQYGLTDSLKKYVLPVIRDKINLDVSVDKVGVNLLGGSFAVHGVQVANPEGFIEPTMLALHKLSIKIGIPALLRGGVAEIKKVVIKDGQLTIIRDQHGALNVAPLLQSAEKAPPAAAPAEPEPPAAAQTVPNIIIRLLQTQTLISFLDYSLASEPFKLGLELQIKLQNLANYGPADQLSGSVDLQGQLLVEEQRCAFELHGQIAPIVDPLRLSCDLAGSMQELDIKAFKGLTKNLGIAGGLVHAAATFRCNQGVFDPDKSVLRLTFKDIQLTPEQQAKFSGVRLPPTLSIVVPVKGDLEHPEIDFGGILEKTLFSPDVIGTVLKNVLEDQGKNLGQAALGAASGLTESPETAPPKLLDVNKNLKQIFGK